jgi:molecular chaperone HtpG
VSLNEYCDRVPAAQEQIYYACGTDQSTVLRDPNLEVFRKRNLEVLLLTDPADEYVLSALGTFREKSIISIDAADLKLPPASTDEQSADKPAQSAADGAVPEGFDRLLEVFRETLGEQVQDVRRSDRLTDSVCCLVNAEGSMSTTMQRILRMNAPDFEMRRMILEVNAASPLIKRLAELSGNPGNNDFLRECGQQLHANAMIQAGLAPNGNEMAARLQNFMLQLAAARP